MNYAVALTIPANTAEADAVIEEIRLPQGVVQKVAILFPAGCAALAHIVVYEYEHQIWPTHLERNYVGDDVLIEFPADYDLPNEWNLFSVRGWNEDTVHDHTPVVFITVLESLREIEDDMAAGWAQFARALRAVGGS